MKFAGDHPLTLERTTSIVKKGIASSSPLEKFMSPRHWLAIGCLLVAAVAVAQTTEKVAKRAVLGKAINVKGLVTVSDTSGIRRVVSNSDVIDRNRYVTSSTGYVTLHLDKGCDIELKPNQALTVEDEKTCEDLWAFIGTGPFVAVGAGGLLLLGGGSGGSTPGIPSPGNPGQVPDLPPQSPQ
jgi:hypothetical protein